MDNTDIRVKPGDDAGFFNPESMPAAIDAWCTARNLPQPESIGEYVRCILESLALKYRVVLEQLGEITGRNPEVIHIIGGGTKNRLLCQFTADATGRKVVAGPAEGTAVGNILMQAKACGYLNTLKEIREVVVNTFEVEQYQPTNTEDWNNTYQRFREICGIVS